MSTKATTIEQSKKLLEAGLDSNTADMCYTNLEFNPHYAPNMGLIVVSFHEWVGTSQKIGLDVESTIPAWSLSALWDLVHGVEDIWYEFETHESSEEVMAFLVEAVVRLAKQKRI